MSLKSVSIEKLFSLLLYIALFLFLLNPYADPDWGWHYQNGKYLFTHRQILREDSFSWTLPGYEWINHSWLYDPLVYLLYETSGFAGLTVAGAVIGFLIFFIGTKSFPLSLWQKALIAFVYIEITFGVFWLGLRSQMIGLLFMSVLLYLLPKSVKDAKYRYFIPLLFIFWANFHGTYLLGLLVFSITIGTGWFLTLMRTESNHHSHLSANYPLVSMLITFIVSLAATLINPFTYQIYLESVRHFSNPLLRNVEEWLPIGFAIGCENCNVFILYALSLFALLIYKRKLNRLPSLILSLLGFMLALSARRYMAVFMVLTLPAASELLSSYFTSMTPKKVGLCISLIAILIGLEVRLTQIPAVLNTGNSFDIYCSGYAKCTDNMAQYLIDNPPSGRGFNFYDWGGYLIGRGVPVKLFVDGRMHLWEKDGYSPFGDYIRMYYWGDEELFLRYDFDWLLIENTSQLYPKVRNSDTLGKWLLKYDDASSSLFIKPK